MNTNTINAIVSIIALIMAGLAFIADDQKNSALRRFGAWILITLFTLLVPVMFGIWVTFQLSYRALAPSVRDPNDIPTLVSQIVIWTSAICSIFVLIWGIFVYPYIKKQIPKILVKPAKTGEEKE